MSIHILLAQWPSTKELEDLSIFLPESLSSPFLAEPRRDVICAANELTMFQCKLLITGHCTHLLFNHHSQIATARLSVQCSICTSSFMNE